MHWFVEGVKTLTNAVLVLVLAWSLGSAMDACGTASFISGALKGGINPGGLPALVFVISALISFATGTSWGYGPFFLLLITMLFHVLLVL